MIKKYSVSLVYQNRLNDKIELILRASIVDAVSTEEALGKLHLLCTEELPEHSLFLQTVIEIENN